VTLAEAIRDVASVLPAKVLRNVLDGAAALERGDRRRGARLIRRQAGELRRFAGHRREAVEVLLGAAGTNAAPDGAPERMQGPGREVATSVAASCPGDFLRGADRWRAF